MVQEINTQEKQHHRHRRPNKAKENPLQPKKIYNTKENEIRIVIHRKCWAVTFLSDGLEIVDNKRKRKAMIYDRKSVNAFNKYEHIFSSFLFV